MATVQKVLGQSAPGATTATDLYTVPALKYAVISTLIACNKAAIAGTIRISVAVVGAAVADKQYLYYDVSVPANDTLALTIGVTLATTDVIRVYASSANFSFSAFGTEGDV